MKRITPDELAEMRARGFDRVLLEQASEAVERGRMADELITTISEAFREVTLGDGVGLRHAQGLDDYEDGETCAAYRESDEKDDWRAISSDDLNSCNSSLSFFDAEGMRFHLPAYMTAELRGDYRFGMSFCLTHLDAHGRTYFTALSEVQRQAVRLFLLFLRDDPDYQFDREEIDQALESYWTAERYSESTNAQQGGAPNR
ncbi:hypothetical protein JIN85_20810 [Luteolibacter pohnpeiensis]|uniref:Uncharacterized protein n=2 Tax=Luteolibacter pohnpeiensis TaxID=454153 RepID=A0A934SBH6_9BACT|nr:hypothetical protein [Luteolibacter pohnpeiensis]